MIDMPPPSLPSQLSLPAALFQTCLKTNEMSLVAIKLFLPFFPSSLFLRARASKVKMSRRLRSAVRAYDGSASFFPPPFSLPHLALPHPKGRSGCSSNQKTMMRAINIDFEIK